MFAVRNTVSAIARANSMMVMPKRTNIISGPPQNKISGLEKAFHFSAIVVGLTFIPGWILVHLKDYNGRSSKA